MHSNAHGEMKPIIDVTCGGKAFWFNKNNPDVVFCDKRSEMHILCDGRTLKIEPDIICDFTALPFADNQFKLVVFDPPHLLNLGENSWTAKKYGKLPENWRPLIKNGFNECMRVLDDYGTLIFKWSETQIKIREILKTIEAEPLFGDRCNRRGQTIWLTFMKTPQQAKRR